MPTPSRQVGPARRPAGESQPLGKVLVLGLAAGILAGLFGIGGGAVLVPGLVLMLGFAQHRAHATSLAAIIITAAAALVPFALDGAVAYLPGAALSVGAVAGAFAGAGVMHRLSAARLRVGFAVLVLVAAARLLVGGEVGEGQVIEGLGVMALAAYLAVGMVTGVLSAIMGVGGGVILVPALVLVFGFDQHTAEGTSLLVILPTAVVGSLRHARNRYTDWRAGALLGLGGIAGGLAGAAVALLLPAASLQRLFAIFLFVTGILLLRRAGQPVAGDDRSATSVTDDSG